jgi:hypothetical protein
MQLVTDADTDNTSEDWQLADPGERAMSLTVVWNRSTRIYPWYRFTRATGTPRSVEMDFGGDLITVVGNRVHTLFPAIAAQRIISLIQPTENEVKFDVRLGSVKQTGRPTISQILIDGQSEAQFEKGLKEEELDELDDVD